MVTYFTAAVTHALEMVLYSNAKYLLKEKAMNTCDTKQFFFFCLLILSH